MGCRFFLQGIFRSRDGTRVSCIVVRLFTVWACHQDHMPKITMSWTTAAWADKIPCPSMRHHMPPHLAPLTTLPVASTHSSMFLPADKGLSLVKSIMSGRGDCFFKSQMPVVGYWVMKNQENKMPPKEANNKLVTDPQEMKIHILPDKEFRITILKKSIEDFPGCLMVKTRHFKCRVCGFNSWLGN